MALRKAGEADKDRTEPAHDRGQCCRSGTLAKYHENTRFPDSEDGENYI
jgi:hypothetical protein